MREILFRGKSLDNGKWVEGSLFYDPDLRHYQIDGFSYYNSESGLERDTFCQIVCSDTVEQYTGFTDKNGTKIFEGDIVKFYDGEGGYTNYEVAWLINRLIIRGAGFNAAVEDLDEFVCECSEVIGNIHDNSELLKEST